MIRGTTPTHIFKIPFSADVLKEIRILYSQNNTIVLEKKTDDCEIIDGSITVHLTQEETLKFLSDRDAYIQIRVLLKDGSSLASKVHRVSVGDVLSDEVIT